jgi:hypothetical protein
MKVCIIMQNTIIKDEHGQDNDYLHYKLMDQPVRGHWREERVAKFIASY